MNKPNWSWEIQQTYWENEPAIQVVVRGSIPARGTDISRLVAILQKLEAVLKEVP